MVGECRKAIAQRTNGVHSCAGDLIRVKDRPFQSSAIPRLQHLHAGLRTHRWVENTSVSKHWLDFWIIRHLRNLRRGFLILLKERRPLFGSIKNCQTRFWHFQLQITIPNMRQSKTYITHNAAILGPTTIFTIQNPSVSGESALLPGSGKTYTMMGSEHGPWISPYCLMNIDS